MTRRRLRCLLRLKHDRAAVLAPGGRAVYVVCRRCLNAHELALVRPGEPAGVALGPAVRALAAAGVAALDAAALAGLLAERALRDEVESVYSEVVADD